MRFDDSGLAVAVRLPAASERRRCGDDQASDVEVPSAHIQPDCEHRAGRRLDNGRSSTAKRQSR
jgi:hypothetical protein